MNSCRICDVVRMTLSHDTVTVGTGNSLKLWRGRVFLVTINFYAQIIFVVVELHPLSYKKIIDRGKKFVWVAS